MPGLEGELRSAQLLEAAELAWSGEKAKELDRYLDSLENARFGESESYFRLGKLQFNRGRFSHACDTLKLGVEKGEGTVRVFTQLAACSLELERVDDFESYLDTAMRKDPSDPLPHKFLAHLNLGQRSFVDAANGCRDILKVTPDDVETLNILAICFAETGELEAELNTYEEILRIQPEDQVIQEKRDRCVAMLEGTEGSVLKGGSVEPLVSAIVSTYNGEAFLGACLDDLLNQSIVDQMEIVVVDSGSEQSEGQIVAAYQQRHSNICYIRTDERETLYAAWNRAVEAARGRYVFNANNDDSRRPDAVEKFVSAMEESPDAALAYADCIWTNTPNDTFPCKQPIREVCYPEYHPALALFFCYTGCLQFWRRSDLLALGGFDGQYRAAGDYEVLMRLAQSEKQAIRIPETLSLFFQNTSGLTQQSSASAEEEGSVRDGFRRALEISMLYSVEGADAHGLATAWTALGCFARKVRIPWHDSNLGDDAFALSCFQKALQRCPKAVEAAANLMVILGEHGQIEIGKRFLRGKEIGWTESQLNGFLREDRKWVNVEVPPAGSKAAPSNPTMNRETDVSQAHPNLSAGLLQRSIQWSAPFFNPSGYGSEALNFVAPLGDQATISIRHNSSIVSQNFVKGLLPDDRRRLNALVPGDREVRGEISICHGPVSCFEILPGATYHIGRSMFETDRLPMDWVRRCNLMDEIWVPTEFNRRTFIESGVESRKVVVIPGAVDEIHFDPQRHEAAVLPNRAAFNFLSVFEWIWRKGWDVLLKAYFKEFGPEDDVCLYLRTYEINCPDGEAKAVLTARVLEVARDLGYSLDQLPRFEILSDQVAYQELPSLYKAAQCLVAPSRGEGWGRPHHESMMMGVPVIATNWSGNTEFMSEENSYLLDYHVTPVQGVESAFGIYDGHEWAEPSMEHLRQLMRRASQSPDEVASKGRLAREQMLERFSRKAVTETVMSRFRQLENELDRPLSRIPVSQLSHSMVPSGSGKTLKERVNWVGPFSDLGSLAQVNRYLTKGLSDGLGKNLIRVEPEAFVGGGQSYSDPLGKRLIRKEDTKAILTIRHHWPPSFEKPTGGGALVLIQPWEFGSLPSSWVHQSEQIDEFWVYSEYVRRVYVDSGVNPSRVKVLPLGVDLKIYSANQKAFPLPTKKRFKFLFVGGTIRRKGPDALLSGYGDAFTDADDVTLVIKDFGGNGVYAGQTFESEIEAFRSRVGSPEIVYLNDELTDEEVAGLYVSCDCLVHPYRGEGFGLPVLEAMSCGIPVVVSRGGACDDFTPDECAWGIETTRRELGREVGGLELIRDGWWLEPSIDSLSTTLRHVATHPDEVSIKGARAETYVREHWTWEHAAKRVIDLASDLLERRQPIQPKRVSERRRNQKQITLPSCARKGDLAGARALFGKNRLAASWDAICKEIGERPFHPEAYLLLGEVASKAGDEAKANSCSKMLSALVPNWAPAKQFVRKLRKRKGRQHQREVLGDVPLPDTEQRVSVCLITRNEEQFIRACLESVKGFAHEMIVVDTGSDDQTQKIAEEVGAQVYHLPWGDDFSEARNEALKYVTGDWVLVLDADEVLAPEAIKELLREVNDRKAIGYRLPITNEGAKEQGTGYVPRLFRNAPGLFYVGRIHEQVFSSVEVRRRQWGMENRLGHSRIIHFGYTEEMTQDRDKVARNLRLLKLAVEEMPDDANLMMNLGLELARSGNESESLRCYRSSFDLLSETPESDIVPELRESLLTQFTSALVRNQCFAEARDVFSGQGVPESAMTASLSFIKGLAMMRTGSFSEAVDAFRDCTTKRDESTHSNGYSEAYGPAPFHCEALCLQKLGREEEARRAFENAVEDENVPWLIVRDFAIYLSSAGLVLEALTLLHSKLPQFKDELSFWLLGARIGLDNTSSLEFALDWIGEGIKHVGEHSALMIEYVKALMLNDRSDLPEGWPQAIEPACESAASWAVRLIGGMLDGRAIEGIVPVPERELSFEVIRLYRRLLTGNAKKVVMVISDRLSLIEPIAPTAAKLMKDAVDEANALSV
ncbi:glycosyltransferase [bacterium]|nr:glycosyltransferase [bacterium]